VVVTQDRAPAPTQEGHGKVSALDLSTGAVVWDLDDRYAGAEVEFAGGDTVVLDVLVESRVEGRVLAADGDELTEVVNVDSCATDRAVVACSDTGGGVDVLDLGTGVVTHHRVSVFSVDLVRDGRIYLSSGRGAWSVDTAGNVIDKSLPGRVTAMTDEIACFTLFGSFSVACHALL
jgi:outer membrane protein assembly factor BamB